MSPTTHCYFDYYQSQDRSSEPRAIGSFTPLEKVYAFDPLPAGLAPAHDKHILGGQANLWTEYIATPDHVEYMAFPRMVALAEALWSPAESLDWTDFYTRLKVHLERLDALQVNFRPLQGVRPREL
jgi:hexosaminidase